MSRLDARRLGRWRNIFCFSVSFLFLPGALFGIGCNQQDSDKGRFIATDKHSPRQIEVTDETDFHADKAGGK